MLKIAPSFINIKCILPSTWKNHHNFFFDLYLLFSLCMCVRIYIRLWHAACPIVFKFLLAPIFGKYLDGAQREMHHF